MPRLVKMELFLVVLVGVLCGVNPVTGSLKSLLNYLDIQGKLGLTDNTPLLDVPSEDVDEIVPISPIRNHPEFRIPQVPRAFEKEVDNIHFSLGDLGLFLPSNTKSKTSKKELGYCTRHVLEICDLKELAKILEHTQSPCELLKAYESCVDTELIRCSDPEAELMKASLASLFTGFMLNGHCGNTHIDLKHTLKDIIDFPMACAPEETLSCARIMQVSLRGTRSVCVSLHRFNHCLHKMTSSCPHSASKYLRDGGHGLNKVYRHVGLCKHSHYHHNIHQKSNLAHEENAWNARLPYLV